MRFTLHRNSNRSQSQRGAILQIALLIILVLAVLGAITMRSTVTFQKITGAFRGKKQVTEIAEIGANRAIQEMRRRFSSLANPEGTVPISNAQYRAMFNSDYTSVAAVLSAYADDIYAVTDPTCSVTTPLSISQDYGDDITDISVCIAHDDLHQSNSALGYDYTVRLVNRDQFAPTKCGSAGGFNTPTCGDDNMTRTITEACRTTGSPPPDWSDPSCRAPDSYHLGDISSLPALGYRLIFESTATDSTGKKAVVTKEMMVFVRQMQDVNIATKSILIDGMNFMLGGNFAGQVRQMIPQDTLERRWFGYHGPGAPLTSTLPKYFYLGRHFSYNALVNSTAAEGNPFGASNPFADTVTPAHYAGTTIREIISNIGVDPDLAARAGIVKAFAMPDDKGNYEAVFGATNGLPIPIGDGGDFDRQELLDKIQVYYFDTLGVNSQLAPTDASSHVFVNNGTPDQFFEPPGSTISNNLSGENRLYRSTVLSGNFQLDGAVYIDGDLVLSGDVNFRGNGKIIARRNIYTLGNVTVQNKPLAGAALEQQMSTGSYPYAQACASATCDSVELIAVGNFSVGNPTNLHKTAFDATITSAALTQASLMVAPLDGLGPNPTTDYGANFQPMKKRNDTTLFDANYKSLLQVGLGLPSDATLFPPPIYDLPASYPNYDPLPPESTFANGLLPEGAGSAYGTTPGSAKQYFFHWFRNPAGQIPAWGGIRPFSDFAGGDGLGRGAPGCSNAASVPPQCNPQAPLNGGFVNSNVWGVTPTGVPETPWIKPQTMHQLYFAGAAGIPLSLPTTTITNTSPNSIPGVNPNTYDRITGNWGVPDGTNYPSWVSNTRIIEAKVSANVITGWGGDAIPTFWNGGGFGPDLGTTSAPYVDRDDATTCPGSFNYDCDQNGLTIWGANGNISLMTQGGLFVYSNNFGNSVSPEDRLSIVTSSQTK